MKQRGHLYVVTNNVPKEPSYVAHERTPIDWMGLWHRVLYWFGLLRMVVLAPFKLVAFLGRTAVAVGRWVIRSVVYTVLGTVGAVIVFFLIYGLGKVLLYPLFH